MKKFKNRSNVISIRTSGNYSGCNVLFSGHASTCNLALHLIESCSNQVGMSQENESVVQWQNP